jgi:hypothetical protein
MIDRISNSMLGEAEDSIELFHGRFITRTIPLKKQTPDMLFGNLFHDSLLLGIDNQAVLVPVEVLDAGGKRNGGKFKEWALQNSGKVVLVHDEWDRLRRMVDAVSEHPLAGSLLNKGDAVMEQSILWEDEPTGLKLKSRLDCRRLSIPLIIDLKTVRDISYKGLAKSVYEFGYARQCAFYKGAAEAAFGYRHDFIFIAVEKEAPYRVRCFDLNERAMQRGWEDFRGGLDRLAECFCHDDWHSRGWDEVVSLDLPNWAYTDQWELADGNSN